MKRITLTLTNAQEQAIRKHAADTKTTPSKMAQKMMAILMGITNDPEIVGETFIVNVPKFNPLGYETEQKTFRVDPVVVAKVVEFGRNNRISGIRELREAMNLGLAEANPLSWAILASRGL